MQPTFDTAGMTTIAVLHKEITRVVRRSGDLSMVEYRILLKAVDGGGALRVGEIAMSLGIGPSAVTQAVDVLERRDLVVRASRDGDGRETLVKVSAAGRSLLDRTDAGVADHLVALWGAPASPEHSRAPYWSEMSAIGLALEGPMAAPGATSLAPSAYITSFERAFRGAARVLREVAGATFTEARVLQFLVESDGSATISELAAELLLPSSTTANVLDRLEQREWALRRRSTDAVRSTHVELTSDGGVMVRKMREALDDYGRRELWRQLDPEQAATTYEAAVRLVARVREGSVR
jgi:DNA-binding MarR family transcriptional regulator